MTVVSSQEFATNQNKYFDMAMKEQVFVQRGNNMFHLICANDDATVKERVYYEPDEDFYRSITIDELRKSAHEFIHQLFTNNENNSIITG
jgi:predicted transcriptional regulator